MPVLLGAVERFRAATHACRVLPDFLILGGQKCGTTALHAYLLEHPCIAGGLRKEVQYFTLHYARGEAWYRAQFPTRWVSRRPARRCGRPLVVGDASPYYLFHPLAPLRAARLLPTARLIVLLRDPVERAYSHYHHEVRKGRETLTFEEAIRREPERLAGQADQLRSGDLAVSAPHQRHSYLGRGLYVDQLHHWLAVFPREQLLILDSAALERETAAVVGRVLDFLGVQDAPLQTTRRHGTGQYAPMAPETRAALRAHFAPYNRRLRDELLVDFGWDQPAALDAAESR
ncbi:MAG: sulfotransferase domain-containing protein [Gemmatimonadota bacterium]